MRPSDRVRQLNSDRYDVLSIPNCVIKKGPSHGRRHGNTERQIIYSYVKLSSKKAKKKVYKSMHRFLRCPIYRKSHFDIGWAEEHCKRLIEIAAEDHSNVATAAERARRENIWVFVLDSSGPNGPVNQREDCGEAKKTGDRFFQEAGQAHHRLHLREQVRSRPDQPCAWFGARRPEDRLEVVRHSANNKFFFLRMATVCVMAIFIMVTEIKVG